MLESSVFAWSDRALFIGARSETEVHAHNAIEITVALDEQGLDVAVPGGPDLRRAPGVMVAADARHQLRVHGPKVAVLYLDPRGAWGAALSRALGGAPARRLGDDASPARSASMLALLGLQVTVEDADMTCEAVLTSVASAPERPRVDPRVARALTFLEPRMAEPPTLAEVAQEMGLSSSRAGHLFKAQVGLPLRRYVLWMRLRGALTEALATGNLTAAAHAAGFSDAAHFARTCKRMFGLPASAFAPVDRVLLGT